MNVNAVKNSPSFGALKIKYNGVPTKVQRKLVRSILRNPLFTDKLQSKLEIQATDILISTRNGSDSVSLKLVTTLHKRPDKQYIPYDSKFNTKMETLINPNGIGIISADTAISNFFKRAGYVDVTSPKNSSIKDKIVNGNKF